MDEQEKRALAPGMQVLTSDGELLGTVEEPKSDGFMLRRMSGGDPAREPIPDMWVQRVDESVHLNRTGAEAVSGWKSLKFRTTQGDTPGLPEEERLRRDENAGPSWIVWAAIAAIVVIAALIFAFAF